MQFQPFKATFVVGVLSFGLLGLSSARGADTVPDDVPPAARAPRDGGQKSYPMLQRVRKAVGEMKLDDDKRAKIDRYLDETQDRLKQIRVDADGDKKEINQKSREALNALRQEISAELDDDQKAELQKKLRPAGPGGKRDFFGQVQSAIKTLSLSSEQQEKVRQIFDDVQKQVQEISGKAQNNGLDAVGKIRSLVEDTREKLGDLLTDEQKQKLQELLHQAQGGGDGQPQDPAPRDGR